LVALPRSRVGFARIVGLDLTSRFFSFCLMISSKLIPAGANRRQLAVVRPQWIISTITVEQNLWLVSAAWQLSYPPSLASAPAILEILGQLDMQRVKRSSVLDK
jgi:hypothetical protein